MENDFLDELAPEVESTTPDMPDVGPFCEMYRKAYDASRDEREEANMALDYYHGKNQISARIKAEMARRRQPPAYNNKIRPAIDGVLGLLDSGQVDPKAVGRNEQDEESALVVTQLLRYAGDINKFHEIEQDVSFDFFIPGVGASIIEAAENGDPRVSHIPYDEFFWDPSSTKHNFSDARYLGRAMFVNRHKAALLFPEFKDVIAGVSAANFDGSGPENQPEQTKIWIDTKNSVLLVEMYYIDDKTGQWCHVNFCHGGVMDFGISPYLDNDKQPACPIKAITYQIDRENNRYGLVRDMIPRQDSINSRESRMLHLTNASQVEAVDGTALPTDRETARKEASKADGAMPMGWRRVPVPDIFQQNYTLLQHDLESIERMAPSPALLGRSSGANQSGRQSQILQQAGMSELARAFARWETWQLLCYQDMWFRMRDHMDMKRMIRVTDEAGTRQMLMVNYPTGDFKVSMDPATGQPVQEPVLENALAELEMDVTITTTRQVETLRGEAVQAMFEFCAKSGISPLSPDFELVLEMSDLPNKPLLLKKFHTLLEKKQKMEAQQAEQQMAVQQAQLELQARSGEASIMRNTAEAEKLQALARKHDVEAVSEATTAAWKQDRLNAGLNPDEEAPVSES